MGAMGIAVSAVLAGAMLSFWGWLAVKVIEQGRKLVELEARFTMHESDCANRLEWMRTLETQMKQIGIDTAAIRLLLGEKIHAE